MGKRQWFCIGVLSAWMAAQVAVAKKENSTSPRPSDQILNSVGSMTLKLKELSGLTAHPEIPETFLAIGDRSYEVVQFQIPSALSQLLTFDFRNKVPGTTSQRSSQWEAIQTDPSGNVFILVEEPARLLVFDLKSKEVKGSYDLSVNASHPLGKAWRDDASSRGEGLLLLEDGLILVAKEKNPPALMLFGPAGKKLPAQIQPLKSAKWSFPESELKTLQLLSSWDPSQTATTSLADLSDLAADSSGQIFLLSDESRRLCELKSPLLTTALQFDTGACFVFPEKLTHPEGLSVQGSRMIVGLDNMAKKTNVHAFIKRPITP
ncbi:MAG: hypothetical protein K2X47_13640 [Bdellovibrionales bacterium]|nr:hypothetical protein [Bdellovibrionales bacterium]